MTYVEKHMEASSHGAFYFRLSQAKVSRTKELVEDCCYLDVDSEGEPVGIEIIGFSLPAI